MHILLQKRLTVDATTDEAEALCMSAANHEVDDGAAIVAWLEPRLISIEPPDSN